MSLRSSPQLIISIYFLFYFCCFKIKLTILIWQWCAVVSNPTMIESFPLRTRENSSINTKLPSTDSWSPSIANNAGQQIAQTTVAPIYNTIKLTHEDVVKGSNSVYGSQFSNGGMIFSINGKSATTNPLISAGNLKFLSSKKKRKKKNILTNLFCNNSATTASTHAVFITRWPSTDRGCPVHTAH